MVKAKVDKLKEKEAQKFSEWLKRTAREHVRRGGNDGAIFTRPPEHDPLVKAANEYYRKKHLREVN
jgi:hypothetical protein